MIELQQVVFRTIAGGVMDKKGDGAVPAWVRPETITRILQHFDYPYRVVIFTDGEIMYVCDDQEEILSKIKEAAT